MEKRGLVAVLMLAVLFLSVNVVSAESFADLNEKITDSSHVVLDDDVVLNQNASGEENLYKEGIPIANREIHIDGNGHEILAKDSKSNSVRIFNITNSNVTLSNMVLSSACVNGSGGAISLDIDSTLILRNVTFTDNSALGLYGEGAAVYAMGTLLVYDCVFKDNHATGAGGAIYASILNCSVSSSRFFNNSADWYGGAICAGSSVNVDSSIFAGNEAYSGGAFHYSLCSFSREYDGSVLSNSNFTNNLAYFGGAISASTFRNLISVNCSFVDNSATKGGVFYKSGRIIRASFERCLIENNSAEIGGFFYDDAFLAFADELYSATFLCDCILKNNVASIMSSVFYGKSAVFWVNHTQFYDKLNKPIYNGVGNITVMNSVISGYCEDFIAQFMGGNVIFINNTCDGNDSCSGAMFDLSEGSTLVTSDGFDEEGLVDLFSLIQDDFDDECCSVYLRLNQTDFTLSHRRDRGINQTIALDKNDNFIRQFKPVSEYFILSKVYTNGWVIGMGGWDDSCENEKVEAIASDMVKNEKITREALEAILKIKKSVSVGHMLIVAPDGSYGNVISYKGDDLLKMGVLGDGDYIISPNSPDFWREGHLDNIDDVVQSNINLSARDEYGYERHCILVHHISLDDNGFSDDLYVTNEDGSFVNDTANRNYVDSFWFKEKFTPNTAIPSILDYMYLGTFYDLKRTIISKNATRGYNSDYVFEAKFLNRDGDFLVNATVSAVINGNAMQFVTDDEGIVKIPFYGLKASQSIVLANPVTGDIARNMIEVVSRLVGKDVVMDYGAESRYVVRAYGEDGNPAGKNQVVTVRLDGKTYEIKTDSRGIATFAIPKALMPGTYDLEASYGGQTIKNTVEVRQIPGGNDVPEKSSKMSAVKPAVKTAIDSGLKKKEASLKITVAHDGSDGDFMRDLIDRILKNPFDLIYLCLIAPLFDLKIAYLPWLVMLWIFFG